MGFEPMIRFWRIHTFQACAIDQLGHLSSFKRNNLYQILVSETAGKGT